MTNDYRKGWRYKLRTDANARRRRDPEVRRRVEHFREHAARECSSRARTRHGGELEVHHIGGIKRDQSRQRLAYMCEDHNRADAGQRPHGARKGTRIRARARRRWIPARFARAALVVGLGVAALAALATRFP